MPAIFFEGEELDCRPGESVLDALNRHGKEIPSGCRAGVCQACVLLTDEQQVAARHQQGLSAAQRDLNYFLSCQCQPTSAIRVRRPDSGANRVHGKLVNREWLSDQVVRLQLDADMDYRPGQYITLWKDSSTARSYSLASHQTQDKWLELHVKHIPGGAISPWLCNGLKCGDELTLQGPMGSCVYSHTQDRPLLLAAIGTGLAPVLGVLKDALVNGHHGPIYLLVGAARHSGFYYQGALLRLIEEFPQVELQFLVQTWEGKACPGLIEADIYQYCRERFSDLSGYGVYLCGAPTFVQKMRKQAFMAGAAMSDIATDAFLAFGETS